MRFAAQHIFQGVFVIAHYTNFHSRVLIFTSFRTNWIYISIFVLQINKCLLRRNGASGETQRNESMASPLGALSLSVVNRPLGACLALQGSAIG